MPCERHALPRVDIGSLFLYTCAVMKRRVLFALQLALLVATLAFIWGNSMEPVSVSAARSTRWAEFLMRLFGNLPFDVRKAAHVAEYGLLGLEAGLLLLSLGRLSLRRAGVALLGGAVIAAVDETLQVLSDRGPAVSDVLLDLLGYSIGFACVMLPLGVVIYIRKKHENGG